MTGHRDPIEDWLSRDVEVLPPPAGAFQRVRRRARRRKAIQAGSAAAGVAIVIAAGISVPALTGNLFQGTGPARLHTAGPSASSAAASRKPKPSSSVRPGSAEPALSTAGSGPAPEADFHPLSVTFVGSGGGELGAVLGRASCGTRTCTAMAGTRTYGSQWTKVGVPPAGPAAVSQVRFADADNGWAFGPDLWATHNGGARWKSVTDLTGRVVDLATVDNQVLAVTATGCPGTGGTAGCTGFELYAAAVTSDRFIPVLSRPRGGLVTPGGLQLQPTTHAGYLIAGGRLYSGALDGSSWGVVRPGSAGAPGCLTGQATGSTAVLAPGAPELYAACATGHGLEVYRSGTSGRTWQAAGAIPAAGTATSLAVSPAGMLVLATTRDLYYSPNAKTWRPAGGSAAGMGFRYVGMTTDRLGVAVPASASAGTVYVTTDGGSTWQSRRISK